MTNYDSLMIDGDILLYSVGFATDKEPPNFSCATLRSAIDNIIRAVGQGRHVEVKIALSGPTNFRKDVATLQKYKGNREDNPKPSNMKEMKDFLIRNYDVVISEDEEADDLLGKFLTEDCPEVRIIATLDKDLDTIPGYHYNWKRKEFYDISEMQACDNFIGQLLTGDTSDNIPGLYRITGKVATKSLKEYCKAGVEPCNKFSRVLELYYNHHNNRYRDNDESRTKIDSVVPVVAEIAELVWIRRSDIAHWSDLYVPKKVEDEET